MTGIYKITNKINEKRYIGQAVDIKTRWALHVNCLNGNRHHNRHLQASWNKYGENMFCFDVIEECNEFELDEKEKYWIEKLKANREGYNLTAGGDGARGYVFTKEDHVKMSLAQKGNKKWAGKKHSLETKQKISLSNMNRIVKTETRVKISKALTGTKASESTKQKLSMIRKGILAGDKNPMYGVHRYGKDNPMYGMTGGRCHSAKKVSCDGKTFQCVNDCAVYYGIGYSSMRSYLNGQRKMPEKFKELNLHYLADKTETS